jgi:AcrR family transcriptional regulator
MARLKRSLGDTIPPKSVPLGANMPAEVRTRDADRTRQTILDAAKAEFARYGLAGARVDAIAEAADVNKRMLYYYFGNKEDLFLAVLEAAYAHIRAEERKLNLTRLPPQEAIAQLVAFTWRYYLANPEFLTLLNNENMLEAVHVRRSAEVKQMHSPFVAMLADVVARGVADGSFRAGVDPVQLYVSIAALSYFYLGNRHTLSAIFTRDLLSPKAKSERLAHMTDVVLGYLRA